MLEVVLGVVCFIVAGIIIHNVASSYSTPTASPRDYVEFDYGSSSSTCAVNFCYNGKKGRATIQLVDASGVPRTSCRTSAPRQNVRITQIGRNDAELASVSPKVDPRLQPVVTFITNEVVRALEETGRFGHFENTPVLDAARLSNLIAYLGQDECPPTALSKVEHSETTEASLSQAVPPRSA